jgi:predicted secreted protein
MAAYKGNAITLTWGGSSIAGVRENGISLNGEAIDITDNDSLGNRQLLDVSSQDEVNISLSGVTKDEALKTDWFAGDRTKAVVLTFTVGGGVISGDFYLQSYTDTGPYNEAATYSAELLSTGPVTFVAG